MPEIRVLIVDDHDLYKRNVISMLESQPGIKVIGEVGNGSDAIVKAGEFMPDIILMDLKMPLMDGIEATRIIKSRLPQTKIVILTVSAESKDLFESIKAGASGYILKDSSIDDIVEAVQSVHSGGASIDPNIASHLLAEFNRLANGADEDRAGRLDILTQREKEILELVAAGLSNKEIACEFNITERTVKNHIANMMTKLHAQNRVQLASYVREGKV